MDKYINLKAVKVNHDLIQKLFEAFPMHIKRMNFDKEGYKFDEYIYFNGLNKVVCIAGYISYILQKDIGIDDWKHIILNLDEEQIEPLKDDVSGSAAWKEMQKYLNKYYSEEEIKNILSSYTDKYDDDLKQWHYYEYEIDEICKFDNVVKYDMNGAHADALIEMFPKAENALRKLYAKRKEDGMEKVKAYFNYTVGMFKKMGYDGAYNHIVQRTTKKLQELYVKIGGTIVYVNTDGIAVSNPKTKISSSNELGEFKIEYEGIAYTYGGNCYVAVQWGKKKKNNDCLKGSSCLKSVRDKIDLSKNKIVRYDKVKNEFGLYDAKNIQEVIYENKR